MKQMSMVLVVVSCLMFGRSFAIPLMSNTNEIEHPIYRMIAKSNKAVDEVMEEKIKRDVTKVGLIAGVAGVIGAGTAHVLMSGESHTRTALKLIGSAIAVCGFGAAVAIQQ